MSSSREPGTDGEGELPAENTVVDREIGRRIQDGLGHAPGGPSHEAADPEAGFLGSKVREDTAVTGKIAAGARDRMPSEARVEPPRPEPTQVLVDEAAAGNRADEGPLANLPTQVGAPARASRARPRLIVTRGNDHGREVVLSRAETWVGRGMDNDIVLADISVSRRHVVLRLDGAHLSLADEGSGNGTLVNGVLASGVTDLRDGDEIELGDTRLRLVMPSDATAGPAPPRPGIMPLPAPNPTPIASAADSLPPAVRRSVARTRWADLKPHLVLAAAMAVVLGGLTFAILQLLAPRQHEVRGPLVAPRKVAHQGAPGGAPAPESLRKGPSADAGPAPLSRAALPSGPRPSAAARKPTPPRAPTSAEEQAAALYQARQFERAAEVLRAAAAKVPASAGRLEALARQHLAVGMAMSRGDTVAATSPAVAMASYQQALVGDQKVGNGVHASHLRGQIAKVAPRAAFTYARAGKLEQARAACDTAVNYGVGTDPTVERVRTMLERQAGELYAEGMAQVKPDPGEAKATLERVLRIVPPDSPWHVKASAALAGSATERK